MARARGANARLALATEATYGIAPSSGYRRISFVSASIGEEQALIDGELLGQGREPGDPGLDAANNTGDIVVPICGRQFGAILLYALGAPTTTAGKVAKGSVTFTAQPAASSKITVAGVDFTFVTATPTAGQVQIGATLAATLANAVRVLNASADADVSKATYRLNERGDAILVEHDTVGTAGNSFTLVAGSSPASNATVSGATLAGGAASGGFRHQFQSGAAQLPSFTAEVAFPEVPAFNANFGAKINTLGIQLQRGGNLTCSVGVIAQGETTTTVSTAGTVADELGMVRLQQASATVRRNGVPLADLVGGQFNLSNGLDPVPAIRSDARISGIDEAALTVTGQISVRYSTPELQLQAEANEPCELEFVWTHPGTGFSLKLVIHRVFLPRGKRPVTGPGGVQVDYSFQSAKDPTLGRALTVILDNDQAGTVYGGS